MAPPARPGARAGRDGRLCAAPARPADGARGPICRCAQVDVSDRRRPFVVLRQPTNGGNHEVPDARLPRPDARPERHRRDRHPRDRGLGDQVRRRRRPADGQPGPDGRGRHQRHAAARASCWSPTAPTPSRASGSSASTSSSAPTSTRPSRSPPSTRWRSADGWSCAPLSSDDEVPGDDADARSRPRWPASGCASSPR